MKYIFDVKYQTQSWFKNFANRKGLLKMRKFQQFLIDTGLLSKSLFKSNALQCQEMKEQFLDGFAEYIQAIIVITKIGKNAQYYIGEKIHISKVKGPLGHL